MMITSNMALNVVRDAAKKCNSFKYVYICPLDILCNPRTLQENNNFVPAEYDNSQTSVILFSSGTTGLPKGVELTHKSLYLCINILKLVYWKQDGLH